MLGHQLSQFTESHGFSRNTSGELWHSRWRPDRILFRRQRWNPPEIMEQSTDHFYHLFTCSPFFLRCLRISIQSDDNACVLAWAPVSMADNDSSEQNRHCDANYDDHRIWAWHRVSIGPLLWSGKTRLPVPPRTLIGQPALISPIRPDLAPNRGRRSELFDVILPRPSRPPIAGIIFPCRAPGTGRGSMRCNFMQQHGAHCHRATLARPYLGICNWSCQSYSHTTGSQHISSLIWLETRPAH